MPGRCPPQRWSLHVSFTAAVAGTGPRFATACARGRGAAPVRLPPAPPTPLAREGVLVNSQRVSRPSSPEDLTVRRRRRCRRGPRGVPRLAPPTHLNQRRSLDFGLDVLDAGRCFRSLTVVDDVPRTCFAVEIDTSLGGRRVDQDLPRLSRLLDAWTYGQRISGRDLRRGT